MADYVPLRNKGEQAIVFGIQDMLGDSGEVQVTMFGPEDSPREYGDLRVFPHKWVFATRLLDFSKHQPQRLATWVQIRAGFYGRLNRLLKSHQSRYRELTNAFHEADIILVGHDGFFCVESCAVLQLAKRAGKRCGILGAGFNIPRLLWLVGPLYKMALENSDFCVFREKTAWRFMQSLSNDTEKARLEPDPAFAMRPAIEQEVNSVLDPMEWYREARAMNRPMVVVTVCEKSVVYNCSFLRENDPIQKRRLHAAFMASLLDRLVEKCKAQIVFLPHSIEQGVGNDIEVAKRVSSAMTSQSSHRIILEGDYSGRFLKGVIRMADFCIGERTHSLIGSLSVGTPFIGLTNSADRRTHDILGEMGHCEEQLLDMDDPNQAECIEKVLWAFDTRDRIRRHLQVVSSEFGCRLQRVAELVKGH
ncbi:MAG: polysaccharide pyruvyl transferase family protein [Pirellulaceae bacterium]